ncbi:MAG: hypothetical protein D6688_01955, partial [Alphaproteobacteria bacterium]
MLTIAYTGFDRFLLDRAFFDNTGIYNVNLLSSTPTSIVVENPSNFIQTTLTGSGFTFDLTGTPTGGTVTSMSFEENGLQGTITGMNWSLVALDAALTAVTPVDTSPFDALFDMQRIKIDASGGENGVTVDAAARTKKLVFVGSADTDFVVSGAANDKLSGGKGGDMIAGGAGADIISGGRGGDALEGGGGRDKILGGSGRDMISGGGGRDQISGGLGNDLLDGGTQADTFVFDVARNEGRDWILDFQDGVDMIALAGGTATDITSIAASASGTDTIVTLASGTEIHLKGVD